ncbi:hypothetical protein KP509_23G077600 [Ceratopteris richardii]|uniref:Uncharacterized protein n=1 Tax=Ceratopteris richardii TaxID=49495 RepID=A0A8T2S3B2_CERRI|nr:hypothetical protein KP509_23G077600 [Ceratopteris richardii]
MYIQMSRLLLLTKCATFCSCNGWGSFSLHMCKINEFNIEVQNKFEYKFSN